MSNPLISASFCLRTISSPGLQHHRYVHGDAEAGGPAEDFRWEHTGKDFLFVRQAFGLLQEKKQVLLLSL